MCQAIQFSINRQSIIFRFTDPNPCLPIWMSNGRIMIIPWGTGGDTLGNYPDGHAVHIAHVKNPKWQSHHPRSVRIACDSFMLLDKAGNEHWYKAGFIRGVIATEPLADKAYVLMRNRDLLEPDIHAEWPIFN